MTRLLRPRSLAAVLIIAIASATAWGDLDWNTLAAAGRALFGPRGLHLYADDPELKDGPAVVLVYAGLARLGQAAAALLSHLTMWLAFATAWVALARRRDDSDQPDDPVWMPRLAVLVVAAVPALVWNLPPFTSGEAALWSAAAATTGLLLALPRTGAWLRGSVAMRRVEMFALLVIGTWALLASGTAHLEDAMAITLLVWAGSRAEPGRAASAGTVWAPLAVGLAIAFKPWAVVGLAVLVRRGRLSLVVRDLAIAGAVVAAAWLPFLVAARGGLHSAALNHSLPISGASTLSLLGLGTGAAPSWVRIVQLAGIVVAAMLARRAGALESVAAGMCARLLLDPTTFTYYLSTMLFAVAAADYLAGRSPRRVLIATAGLWLAPCVVTDLRAVAVIRSALLLAVLGSYLWTAAGLGRAAGEGASATLTSPAPAPA